jgi:outer membrane protein assembly factor BamB
MIGSGQRQDWQAEAENQRATTPRLMVGSWAGEAAVVEARTGRVCWLRRTGRELGTLAMNAEVAYLGMGYSYAAMRQADANRDDFEKLQRLRARADIPSHLEARRASDGALLWTYTHPKIKERLHIEAERGIVVVGNRRHFEADVPPIQVFDGMTGDLLWQVEGRDAQWSPDQLIAVRGGHIYARLGDHLDETATALDLRTGKPLWQRTWHKPWIFSPNGALIADRPSMSNMTLIDARDGAELANVPMPGTLHLLTDDGIAYTSMRDEPEDVWLAALDARTGEQVWRAAGLGAESFALDGQILSYARTLREQRIAEIGALDAATGERLWQWQSPATLGELLRLWGARRVPAMLWDSTEKSIATIRDIVWQRWFRLRRPRWSIRTSQRKETIGTRLRGIQQGIAGNVGWPLWHELSHGQWQHLWQLHDSYTTGSMQTIWRRAGGLSFLARGSASSRSTPPPDDCSGTRYRPLICRSWTQRSRRSPRIPVARLH